MAERYIPMEEKQSQRENVYYERSSEQIKKAAERFDKYHRMLHGFHMTHPHVIRSSLDRGTIWYPKDIHSNEVLDFLGKNAGKISFSYGQQEGDHKLLALIAEVENIRHGTKYSDKNIAIMPGAWAGLEYAIQEVVNLKKGKHENKHIAVIGPTLYQMFYSPIAHLGIPMKAYDFVSNQFTHRPESIDDLQSMLKEKPKAIIISNPNNPDAVYFKSDLLKELIKSAEQEKIYIIIDEIQNCFAQESSQKLNYGSWIQSPYVIRVDSPAKRYALANCRVGWIIADSHILEGSKDSLKDDYWEEWEIKLLKEWFQEKDGIQIDDSDSMEEIIEQLPPTRLEGVIGRMSGIMGNAPRIANDILMHLLTQEKKEMTEKSDYFVKNYQIVKEKHNYIIERLQKMPHVSRIYYPEACVNITVQINHPLWDNDMKLAVELMKHGTLIMPTSGYGYNPSQTTLRITFFEREKQLQHSMDVLEQILSTT